MEVYADAFVAQKVDGTKLLSAFTEEFVTVTLGVATKLHAKKLANAAKKLQADAELHETGTEFDSSAAKGPFKFTMGKGQVGGGGCSGGGRGWGAGMISTPDACDWELGAGWMLVSYSHP